MKNYTLLFEFPYYYLYSNHTNKLVMSGPLNDVFFGLKEFSEYHQISLSHLLNDISLKDKYK